MGWDKELKDYRYYLKLEKKLSDNTVRAYLHVQFLHQIGRAHV